MGYQIINAKHIYLSYHNIDLLFALHFVEIFNRHHDTLWFDRFEVSPSRNWNVDHFTAREASSHAIVILSDRYPQTPYCREEYDYFVTNNIPIIAIVPEELTITNALSELQLDDWIDFRGWRDETVLRSTINRVLERLPDSHSTIKQPERSHYLQSFITRVESRLALLPTTRAAFLAHQGNQHDSLYVRNRGYDSNMLTQWYFSYQLDGRDLDIENIVSWYELQSQFVLCGKAGSGKTVVAQLLALLVAHNALHDNSATLPFWFDLALWTSDEPFETFIESQWPLAFYWKHWLDSNQALLVFDNWADFSKRYPERVNEVSNWIASSCDHKMIILTQDASNINLELPVVTMGAIPANQIQRFSAVFLQDKHNEIFQRLLVNHDKKLRSRQVDYVSCGIELAAMDTTIAVDTWHVDPVTSLITLRWQANQSRIDAKFSLDYFIKTMKTLAWHMMQAEDHRFLARATANQVVVDGIPIEVGIQLGLLQSVGDRIQFAAEIFQWYLAAQHLAQDGLYKHLSRPQFLEDGQRQATRWDDVVVALVDMVADEHKRRTVDQIAEIDPYLAYTCMLGHPEVYQAYLPAVITKLIEMRSKNPTSQTAFTQVLQQIPHVEETTIILLQQMSGLEWGVQQWLWLEILRLPLNIPSEFVNRIRRIDRDFQESVFEILSDYPLHRCLSYLAHMINHPLPQIQHNAIWLSGELQHASSRVGLFSLLENASDEICREVLDALAKMGDAQLIKHLMIWLAEHPDFSGDVGYSIYRMGRLVSGRLLMELHEKELEVDDALRNAIIKHPEENVALATLDMIATATDSPELLDGLEVEKDTIMNLQKLLQSGMQQLPRESFNRLIDDINRVLGTRSDGEDEQTLSTEAIVERIQDAIASSGLSDDHQEAVVIASPDVLPEELYEQLQSEDWLIRRKATDRLAYYDADLSIPLLMQSAQDADAQVRIVALNLLAKFTEREEALNMLVSALFDEDFLVVDTATDLLKSIEDFDVSQLMAHLNTDNVQTLGAIIDILGHRQYEEAVVDLIMFLGDDRKLVLDDKTVGDHAAEALITIGTPDALDAVNQSNHNTDLPSTPDSAVNAVAPSAHSGKKSYSDLEKITLSLKALRGDNWEVAQKAARFMREHAKKLRGTQDMALIQPLCEAMSDPNWHVRWAAGEALAWLRHPSAIPYLVEQLNDPNWIVQVTAIRALVELNAGQTASDVAGQLAHPNNAVRETAAEALGTLGDATIIPALEKALDNGDDFVRLAALKSLHKVSDHQNIDYLFKALNDSYVHIRWYAIKHLLPFIDSTHISLLQNLLSDSGKPAWEDKSISDYSVEALVHINTSDSRAVLEQWNKQKN